MTTVIPGQGITVGLDGQAVIPGRDCVLYATASKIRSFDADSSAWFVFFPSDLHRPGVARDGVPSPVRKVVVKIPLKH